MASEYVVIDAKTGCHLREATAQEAAEFRAANPSRTWERATEVRTGAVVDTYYGPGIAYHNTPGQLWD